MVPWQTLVTHLTHEDPEQLLAHPDNWKIHDGNQRQAVEAALEEIGFAGAILVNDQTGHVVDGHLRVELAIKHGAPSVPVLHLNATETEESMLLASYDPLGALAAADRDKLKDLTATVDPKSEPLKAMLTDLALRYHPTQVSDAFTRFLENREDGDDEKDAPLPPEARQSHDEHDEAWATSTLTYAVTAEQRATIQAAIRAARRDEPGSSQTMALVAICDAYLDREI
jgi:hypothetical protein